MRLSNIKALVLVILISIPAFPGVREVVFIGITGDGAPSIEQSFDKQLRELLSARDDMVTADYVQTQHFNRLIRFHDFPVVSRKLVESIERFTSDTTLFIWGYISKYSVSPVRKNILFADITSELDIRISIYSLAKKEYAFTGKIHAEAHKPAGLVLGRSVNTVLHVDAVDKIALTDKCIEEAVIKTVDIISAIKRNQSINDIPAPAANVESYKVPSISDVFSVPSIEARQIGSESNAKDSTRK